MGVSGALMTSYPVKLAGCRRDDAYYSFKAWFPHNRISCANSDWNRAASIIFCRSISTVDIQTKTISITASTTM